jgi:hypothetical protein
MSETRAQILTMPRAGPGVGAEDARQLTHALYLALIEHLEGTGHANRDSFIEDALPAAKAAGMPVETLINGIVRAYTVLVAHVLHELAPDNRDAAGQWIGEFAGALVCDVVRGFGSTDGQ